MTPGRRDHIERLSLEALARDPISRAAYLDEACAGDTALRHEVDSLIAGKAQASGFLETPAWSATWTPLLPGTRLGPYEIEATIGAGGMGEVYRARDTRLRREVAVKVLPSAFSADPDRRARFEREAKAIAGLSHPHICALYDVGEGVPSNPGLRVPSPEPRVPAPVHYLVMEHLSGQTLAARLEKGALPLDQALTVGTEIADALAAAHRQGIVHRDLKPANVMLTKNGTKLLDFGLAKLRSHGEQPVASSFASGEAPSSTLTADGTLVGTLPYMAPEQLEGKPADARTDLWSLGALLYEMVTGKRAFEGTSQAGLVTAIMSAEPLALTTVKPLTPPALQHIVARCLAKDPDQRWESAADLAQALRWLGEAEMPASAPGQAGRAWRAVTRVLLVAIGGAIGALAVWLLLARPAPLSTHMTISISESDLTLTTGGVTISPDGRTVVFAAQGRDKEAQLYVRRLDEREARPLEGTQGARLPFFSPDGEWVGFTSGRALRKVPSRGGAPQLITERGAYGGRWIGNDRIVFSDSGGLWSISPEGGTPANLLELPGGVMPVRYLDPDPLPGDAGIVVTVFRAGHTSIGAIAHGTKELRTLVKSGSRPRYLRTGHLIYESGGQLMAAAFDPRRLEPPAAPRVVVDDIGTGSLGSGIYDVSTTGTLAYVRRSATLKTLAWRDRSGNRVPLTLDPRPYWTPVLSPDGRRLVVCVQAGASRNLWTGSVEGEPLTLLTFGDDDWFGLFTPDGRDVVFTSARKGRYNLSLTSADGSRQAKPFGPDSPFGQKATSFSPTGVLLFNQGNGGQPVSYDVRQTTLDRLGESRPFVDTEFSEFNAAFSPDGRWVAYTSNETGANEIYVTAYPGPGLRKKVSIGGGVDPAWNPRGGELFYQGWDAVMAVRISNGVPTGSPTVLFVQPENRDRPDRDWDVAPDGQRFLTVEPVGNVPIDIVLNWFEELKAKVPARR